ncbi:MAG: hypothetical protein JOZ57_07070, partial [Abitibacteriaceae bacterium]|nr:hypothetical protein [Abditibacteriaceae bacterium]
MLRVYLSVLMACLLASSTTLVCAATLNMTPDGIMIDNGNMGQFTLDYPTLMNDAKQTPYKLVEKVPAGKTATVKYDGGAQLDVTTDDVGNIALNFSKLPADVKWFKTTMLINFSFSQGGHWKIGANEQAFPAAKPAGPKLFQGNAGDLQLTNNQGKSLSFTIPPFSYEELQDNREWGWSIFAWSFITPMDHNVSTYKIAVGSGGAGDGKPVPVVDAFGQSKLQDWPDKVKSLDELKADVESEKAYYDSLQPPVGDTYGGLPGSGAKLGLNKTGFFYVEQKTNKWFLVDPDGNAFFHMGVCGFGPSDDYTLVKGREDAYEWLPPYDNQFKSAYLSGHGNEVVSFHLANTIRKYGQPHTSEDYAARMIGRVKKWGFNSIGAFSPIPQAVQTAHFPYVSFLPLGQWDDGIPRLPGINETWDPFDETNRTKVEHNFAKNLPRSADDPLLIGYFLVNEPLYEDIPKVVPTLKGTFACKRRLVQMLNEKYKTIADFNTAWEANADSFEALNDLSLLVKTKAAAEDMQAFTGLFFESYFQLVSSTFHKYDTHHMLIGNRLQPGTINNEQLCRISGKYLDVISFNYYTYALDKDFLNRIHEWTGGRPMMLSEYYWTAPSESGLVGGLEVASQQ